MSRPIIKTMLEREEKEAEERRRKWEVEREKMARIEAERRTVEEEKARIVELKKQMEDWRFVQAARSLAAAAEELVASRGLLGYPRLWSRSWASREPLLVQAVGGSA